MVATFASQSPVQAVRLLSGATVHLEATDLSAATCGSKLRGLVAQSLAINPFLVQLFADSRQVTDTDLLTDVGAREVQALAMLRPAAWNLDVQPALLAKRLAETQGAWLPPCVAKRLPAFEESEPHQCAALIEKQLRKLQAEPIPGTAVSLVDGKVFHWRLLIVAPGESAYHGGLFECHVLLPERYPWDAPEVYFATSIFHCNVDVGGRFCADMDWDWSPAMGMRGVLLYIMSVLSEPQPSGAANRDAAELFMEDQEAYDRQARQHVREHALD